MRNRRGNPGDQKCLLYCPNRLRGGISAGPNRNQFEPSQGLKIWGSKSLRGKQMKSFFVGIGIGALIGIAIAPKSGAETRRDLLRRGGEHFSRLGENFNQAPSGERTRSAVTQSATASKRDSLLAIINDWTEARLIEIDGIGPVLALKIIQNRPYSTASELTDAKILPPSAIDALQNAA
jgi:gas vesicle protein